MRVSLASFSVSMFLQRAEMCTGGMEKEARACVAVLPAMIANRLPEEPKMQELMLVARLHDLSPGT